MEFEKGDGPHWLENVQCDPTRNRTLLECNARGPYHGSCNHEAGVRCRNERVRNVTADIFNIFTSSNSTVYTVLVTWKQNLISDKPTSFKVECHNKQYSVKVTVGSEKLKTKLALFSSSYNCCVSAVLQLYESKEICTGIMSTTTFNASTCNNPNSTNLANIVGGVLGFTTTVLIILLALTLLRLTSRKRLISQR